MTDQVDVTQFIGKTYNVVEEITERPVEIVVGDGGRLAWWDHRPLLAMTCRLTDGRRAHQDVARFAAYQLAGRLFAPYAPGWMGGDGWELEVARYREKGAKNGGTHFTYRCFVSTLDRWPRYAAMIDEDWSRETVLAQIKADHEALRRGEDVPLTWHEPAPHVPAFDGQPDRLVAAMQARHAARG
jgi:hypothetical protein